MNSLGEICDGDSAVLFFPSISDDLQNVGTWQEFTVLFFCVDSLHFSSVLHSDPDPWQKIQLPKVRVLILQQGEGDEKTFCRNP